MSCSVTYECSFCSPSQYAGSRMHFLIFTILEVSFGETDKKQRLIRISHREGNPFDSCRATCESWTKLNFADSLFKGKTPYHMRLILLPMFLPEKHYFVPFLAKCRELFPPEWFFLSGSVSPFYSYSGVTISNFRKLYMEMINAIKMLHPVIPPEDVEQTTFKSLELMEDFPLPLVDYLDEMR